MTVNLKIKSGRYYAVVCYKEGTEYKQKWVALHLPAKNNKRKAEAMLEQIKRQYEEAYSTPGGDTLFTTYIKKWLEDKKSMIELSTWEGYKIYAERHIIPYFDPMKLSLRDVKPKHIKDYYDFKYTSGRLDGKPGGLSIPSIKKHSIVIKEVLNDAVLDELITRNPAIGVKLPAKDVKERRDVFLTADQANIMLEAFRGHILEGLVYTTLYYGLRRSEALGLRWSAIDFDNGTLTINHTVVKNLTIVQKDSTKTQTSYHTYKLIDDVRRVLLEQKSRQENYKKILGASYIRSDYVFTWENGKLFRPDYVTRAFQRVVREHGGLPDMRFHDLRHSTASVLYDMGWDLKDSQSWLRHSSIEMTADTYTHISEERKSSMADRLNSTFKLGAGGHNSAKNG